MALKIEEFDWDAGNKSKNKIKHKVSVKEAEQVFFDKKAVQFEDIKHSQAEHRIIIIGLTRRKRCLHISFTIRLGRVRIISARDADKKEKQYYANKKTETNNS